jgi:transcriptional regulator with XRE-family HTH domain
LDWSQQKLADQSRIGNATIRNFESGKTAPQHATVEVLQRCFEQAGIRFIEDGQTSAGGGPGVRLLKSDNQFDTDVTQTVQYPEHLQPDAPTGAGG